MGGKSARAGKFLYFCAAGLIVLLLSGCMLSKKGVTWDSSQEDSALKVREPEGPAKSGFSAVELLGKQEMAKLEIPPWFEVPTRVGSSTKEPEGPAQEGLARAKKMFARGDYAGALEENQRVLSLPGVNGAAAQALFNMGLIYAQPENSQRDLEKALLSFRRMIRQYPQSPLADEAKVWVGVLQENKKLSETIEKIKEIDIVMEQKRKKER